MSAPSYNLNLTALSPGNIVLSQGNAIIHFFWHPGFTQTERDNKTQDRGECQFVLQRLKMKCIISQRRSGGTLLYNSRLLPLYQQGSQATSLYIQSFIVLAPSSVFSFLLHVNNMISSGSRTRVFTSVLHISQDW